jgi:hypothetical protein
MIITNDQNFYTIRELSELTDLCYKSVCIKLKRRNISADFIKDKKNYYHSSAVEILKGKLLTYKTIYEKIYIKETYHIYPSKMNYDDTI